MGLIGRADYANAKALYPSCGELSTGEWLSFLDGPAGVAVLGKLLGDAFNAVKDEEDRRNGVRRSGRRPPRFASLEVVIATVFPERFSMDPFPEAMRKLLGTRSQRAFAHTLDLHQTTLSKLMKGTYEPDMPILERIAEAAKVSPGYFLEYRSLFVAELVHLVLQERPQLSSVVLRDLMNLRIT